MLIEKLHPSDLTGYLNPGRYSDGGGLYLQVTRRLNKSWVFRYTYNGHEHGMGFGPLHIVSIKEARIAAQKARTILAQGIDPFEPGGKNSLHKTFNTCAAEYIASHQGAWKNEKYRKQWKAVLQTYVSPYFGSVLINQVATKHVLEALASIWTIKPQTAQRLRVRIERILSWAAALGYRKEENPARWRGHLQELLPDPARFHHPRHFPAMSSREIRPFLQKLALRPEAGARALAFTILTACRTHEVLHAQWNEIDLHQRVWTLSGHRMKNGQMHRVPLSKEALAILRTQIGFDPIWVFPRLKESKPLPNDSMLVMLHKTTLLNATVHGFRAAFRMWAAERGTPDEVAELSLSHVNSRLAYQRSDLIEARRKLMQDWAKWCTPAGWIDKKNVAQPNERIDKKSPVEEEKKKMKQSRRTFDVGFKLQIVKMIKDQNMPLTELCRYLKLERKKVLQWITQVDMTKLGQRKTGKPLTTLQRIQQLEGENQQLRQDIRSYLFFGNMTGITKTRKNSPRRAEKRSAFRRMSTIEYAQK